MIYRHNPSCDYLIEDYYDEAEERLIEDYYRDGGKDPRYIPTMRDVEDKAHDLWLDRFDAYADYKRMMDK
tara:strand:- start:1668 stop:1877 length:210 start_codon:yes stop_codon:yes gene_type:complete